MRLIDLNILLYAVNRDSERHARARAWLTSVMTGPDAVALAWPVILGFIRIATNARIFAQPLRVQAAIATVDLWLVRPNVTVVVPGPDHWRILKLLLSDSGAAGNLTTDTHLAALAIEHGCELCSTDGDFSRFARLAWSNPLSDAAG